MSDTPIRTVRIDDELWTAAQERARRRRESVADVIRRALLAYVEEFKFETRWACTPPPEGSTYRVLRDDWSADYTVRTILEWEETS